jgi:hypothetical protein
MKHFLVYITLVLTFALLSCSDKIEPDVDTLYLNDGDRESQSAMAISELYKYYVASKKDKGFYEVVSKKVGRFILNYYPAGKLLTVSTDSDSGWGRQFKNVDETVLKKLSDDHITIDDIGAIGTGDNRLDSLYVSLLPINEPFFSVKTNGNP